MLPTLLGKVEVHCSLKVCFLIFTVTNSKIVIGDRYMYLLNYKFIYGSEIQVSSVTQFTIGHSHKSSSTFMVDNGIESDSHLTHFHASMYIQRSFISRERNSIVV
jgi:hypothetical protein